VLSGKRVGLRAIEPDDLEALREWRNRPHFRRHFREVKEIGRRQQECWFEEVVSKDSRTLMFSIIDLESGVLLGAAGLCFIDWINRNCDLSIYLGRDDLYIDDELAPDAASVLLDYAFSELNLHRVWVEIYDFDEPKKRFLADLGFRLEGTHRQHHFAEGAWHDSLFWGLLSDEWAARRPAG
jgi:RimJ/RimL family protein N-acetyltransferase